MERNSSGNLINQDYFTANLYPEVKHTLYLVEQAHSNERVWASFFDRKYEGPLGDCQYVLRYFPNHPRALYLLGELAKATNQPSMPIALFERALKLYPQYAYTHAQYGRYLIEIGAREAGVAELNEALRLDPNSLQARAWLAEARTPATEKGSAPSKGSASADSSQSRAKNAPGGGRGE